MLQPLSDYHRWIQDLGPCHIWVDSLRQEFIDKCFKLLINLAKNSILRWWQGSLIPPSSNKTGWLKLVYRVSNFLFSSYISFLSPFFTILFPTYLYKNAFPRKILPETSLLYYKTKIYCFYLYVKFKVHILRRFFNVRLFSYNFLARSRQNRLKWIKHINDTF